MSARWLNYQHYFYFWRVASHGSITKASEELRLSQPTVSAQLKIFEESLGEQLFIRDGRKLTLTEAGKLAFRYAEQIFSTGNEFLASLEGTRATSTPLTIGIADVVPKVISYRIIEPVLRSDQLATLHCHEDKTERLLAELALLELDLIIADAPVQASTKVKAYNHFLGECGVTFLAAPELARQYRRGFPGSLTGAPLLLPTEAAAVRRELDQWFDSLQILPRRIGEFQDSALSKLVAREGKGIVTVPTVVAKAIRKEYSLDVVGTAEDVRERFYIISIEKRLKNPLTKHLVERAQRTLFPGNRSRGGGM